MIEHTYGVGYIQLSGFQTSSTAELDRAIVKLKRQGMRYLVLDLRGNPGGLLNVSVDIADRFLDQGIIVSTRGPCARPDTGLSSPTRQAVYDGPRRS